MRFVGTFPESFTVLLPGCSATLISRNMSGCLPRPLSSSTSSAIAADDMRVTEEVVRYLPSPPMGRDPITPLLLALRSRSSNRAGVGEGVGGVGVGLEDVEEV